MSTVCFAVCVIDGASSYWIKGPSSELQNLVMVQVTDTFMMKWEGLVKYVELGASYNCAPMALMEVLCHQDDRLCSYIDKPEIYCCI